MAQPGGFSSAPSSLSAPPPPVYHPPSPPGTAWSTPMRQPAPAEEERTGIARAKIAAALGILGLALGVGVVYLLFAEDSWLFSISSSTPPSASTLLATFETLFGLLIVTIVLALASLIVFTSAFLVLRAVDDRFAAPAGLGVVGCVGFVMALGGIGGIFAEVLSVVSCAASSGGNSSGCGAGVSGLGGLLVLAGIGSLLLLVGWIGIVIGVYRLGSRYHNTLLKLGGILYIVPFASIIAPILTYLGARQVEKGFAAAVSPSTGPGFGAPPTPP